VRKALATVGIMAVLLFGGMSQAVWAGSFGHGSLPGNPGQVPAPLVPFGGDSSGQ